MNGTAKSRAELNCLILVFLDVLVGPPGKCAVLRDVHPRGSREGKMDKSERPPRSRYKQYKTAPSSVKNQDKARNNAQSLAEIHNYA